MHSKHGFLLTSFNTNPLGPALWVRLCFNGLRLKKVPYHKSPTQICLRTGAQSESEWISLRTICVTGGVAFHSVYDTERESHTKDQLKIHYFEYWLIDFYLVKFHNNINFPGVAILWSSAPRKQKRRPERS